MLQFKISGTFPQDCLCTQSHLIAILFELTKATCSPALSVPPCHYHRSLQFFAADAAGQLDVLGHDGDALGMEGAQVGVLIEANKVGLGRLLEGKHRGSLEAKVLFLFEVLGNLAAKALEGQLADEEISGLLVAADLAEGNGSGAVSVGLLDATLWGG